MYTIVEETVLSYLWQSGIWEPVQELKTHIMGNECICQLLISFWHINTVHRVRSSIATSLKIGPCVFPLHGILWSPIVVMQQQSKPTKPGATTMFRNSEYEHCGGARAVKRAVQDPLPLTPPEFEVAPQSMEIRSLWMSAFVLIRITEMLVCLFFSSLSSMDTCVQAKSIPLSRRPIVLFFFSPHCPTGPAPWTQWRRIFRGLLKVFSWLGLCTAPGNKHRGGHGKAADTESTITCSLYILRNPGSVHCLFSARKQSWGRGQGKVFEHTQEIISLFFLLHVGMGTLWGDLKGHIVPEGCIVGKIRCLAQLKTHSRHMH